MTFFFLNPESQQCELSVETPSHVGVRPRELFKPLLSTGLAASSSALRLARQYVHPFWVGRLSPAET